MITPEDSAREAKEPGFLGMVLLTILFAALLVFRVWVIVAVKLMEAVT